MVTWFVCVLNLKSGVCVVIVIYTVWMSGLATEGNWISQFASS